MPPLSIRDVEVLVLQFLRLYEDYNDILRVYKKRNNAYNHLTLYCIAFLSFQGCVIKFDRLP